MSKQLWRHAPLIPVPSLVALVAGWGFPGIFQHGAVAWLSLTPAAVTFAIYVSVLGFFIHRYAWTSLDGDLRRPLFMANLVITLWAVQGLALVGNVVLFIAFWMLTSWGLHRLLEHYHHRRAARAVAWEKFLVSRLGDVMLIGAAVLLYVAAKSLNFDELAKMAGHSNLIGWATVLLAGGALTKSAQVPFHGWLTRTLEAPTPVSALLHAGLINAGGFLLIRFAFVMVHAAVGLEIVLVAGTLSALWGGLAMVVQPDIKRRLAWSTVGQMGFMMIEIGCGAPGLALVHLMGHGLYKARSFLWSGDASIAKAPVAPLFAAPWRPIVGLILWVAIGVLDWFVLGALAPQHRWLSLIVWAVVVPLIVGGWERKGQKLASFAASTGILAASTVLALGSSWLFGLPEAEPLGLRAVLAVLSAGLLTVTGLVVAFHPFLGKLRCYRAGYGAALNGFSLGRWPEAILERLRPVSKTVSK